MSGNVKGRVVFQSEAALVDSFSRSLEEGNSEFGMLFLTSEFQYPEGRADLIGSSQDEDVIAFEAKLANWRTALNQAYRNSFFAHYSYVILPEYKKHVALRHRHEFERRGVGLCVVGAQGSSIELAARRKAPVRNWLMRSAVRATQGDVLNDGAEACEAR